MSALTDATARLVARLDQLGVAHALIGGLAISARAEVRFTKDADLAVAVPDDNAAERLVRELASDGLVIAATVEHSTMERLSTVRLLAPDDDLYLDLLFASSGIEPEIAAAAEIMSVLGLRLPVAQVGHLIALKLLAQGDARPQDAWDLAELKKVATEDDLALAREAVELIEARGYDRGRDLVAALAALSG